MITENMCIYTKKCEGETFKSQEHIVPASIGGKKKLPNGYVSDRVNNEFSKLELNFARDSVVGIVREFDGPGKRGSLKQASKGKVREISIDEEFLLGYMQNMEPVVIPQIIFAGMVATFTSTTADIQTDINDIDKILKEKELKKYNFIEGKIDTEKYIVGLFKGKVYVLVGQGSKNKVKQELQSYGSVKENKNVQVHSVKNKGTEIHMEFQMDLPYFYTVCCKIIFNFFAYSFGQRLACMGEFDLLRKHIKNRSCEEISKMEQVPEVFWKCGDVARRIGHEYDKSAHEIFVFKTKNELLGSIRFYGLDFVVTVRLSDNIEEIKDELSNCFFVCDWKKQNEFVVGMGVE